MPYQVQENVIGTLVEAYSKAHNRDQINFDRLSAELNAWFLQYPDYHFLHPCVIGGEAALVCLPGLSTLSPEAYRRLSEIAFRHHILLKEDQRRQDSQREQNRRINTAVVLGFCLGLMSAPAMSRSGTGQKLGGAQVSAQLISGGSHLSAQVRMEKGKKVVSLRHIGPPSAEQVLNVYQQKKHLRKVDQYAGYKIQKYLDGFYRPQAGDPVFVRPDLKKIAEYYAQFPEVVELLNELSANNVVLKYKKSHWQAQAQGTSFSVDQVTVYFDTRVGAQFLAHKNCVGNPACHITPADALLHELLHAKLMIVDSEEFIRNGGMKSTLYLFDHEKAVIARENELYRVMTRQDGLARPIRTRHSGDLLHVSCALCLPSG